MRSHDMMLFTYFCSLYIQYINSSSALLLYYTGGLVEDPKSISMRGRHFKKEIKIIGKWRETKDFAHFSIQEDQRGTFKQNLKEVKPENIFPLFLNLVSCFLFMMNNYIIEPSSAYYAEALGSSDVSFLCILSCVHIICLIF